MIRSSQQVASKGATVWPLPAIITLAIKLATLENIMRISTVESLDRLLEKLQSLYNEQEQVRCKGGDPDYNIFESRLIDLLTLQTFGGAKPKDLHGIGSWDETRYLICDDKLGIKIVLRPYLDGDGKECYCNECYCAGFWMHL